MTGLWQWLWQPGFTAILNICSLINCMGHSENQQFVFVIKHLLTVSFFLKLNMEKLRCTGKSSTNSTHNLSW